jgi:hypothetical protein
MNFLAALGVLLFGVGLGGLLVWLQQTAARRQFRQELEAELDQALFGLSRRQAQLNIERMSLNGANCEAAGERGKNAAVSGDPRVDRTYPAR